MTFQTSGSQTNSERMLKFFRLIPRKKKRFYENSTDSWRNKKQEAFHSPWSLWINVEAVLTFSVCFHVNKLFVKVKALQSNTKGRTHHLTVPCFLWGHKEQIVDAGLLWVISIITQKLSWKMFRAYLHFRSSCFQKLIWLVALWWVWWNINIRGMKSNKRFLWKQAGCKIKKDKLIITEILLAL